MTQETPFAYDDLTTIKGIGPARQQWLRETFGIVSYADLAGLSADAIYERLKEGQIASPTVIDSWIRQAQALAAAPAPRPQPVNEQPEWKPVASFVVEFQQHEETGTLRTSVHHVEADRTHHWPGVQQAALCQWMTAQLGDHATAAEVEKPAPAPEPSEGYSSKLQQMLAKVNTATSMPAPKPMPVPQTAPVRAAAPAANTRQDNPDRLQQLIAKTRRLSGQ